MARGDPPPGRLDRLLRRGVRTGMQRGLGDGSAPWLAIGALALGVRLLRWMARPAAPTIVRELLEPGQAILITHLTDER